jgi:hypothetical protein
METKRKLSMNGQLYIDNKQIEWLGVRREEIVVVKDVEDSNGFRYLMVYKEV